ncbi:aminoacyl-tRNA hydrolase [Zhihengliuella sp.]|uniref:aminoacyl-tRNA hydrolase n=1 Tax=Zhihengliuella sp. TaxID=1954483 RepID=UPI00281240B8|nr:aminoacyl-tRNA hydrolase [Zhihengliuella sp.]
MALFERDDRELMQQIVLLVDKDRPALESEGVAAAAIASVNAFLAQPDRPEWRQWAAVHFGKSVRRADARTFPKIVAEFAEPLGAVEGEARLEGGSDGGLAIAFVPAPKEELPKKIAKLQVSGTALPRTLGERAELLAAREDSTTPTPEPTERLPSADLPDGPEAGRNPSPAGEASPDGARAEREAGGAASPDAVVLVLNDTLGMSTGKACAQAAHALFAWLLDAIRRDHPRVDAWLEAGQPVSVRWAGADDFKDLQRQATGPLIRDAGRTEIETGSVTAFVV